MATIDNSKVFLNGIYGDATVTVAANTTLKKGTVLGLNSSDKLVAFSSTLAGGDFVPEPSYILAQDVVNATNAAVDYDMIRVFESGEVDAAKVVFTTAADATDAQILAAMKNNGFHLVNVQQMA